MILTEPHITFLDVNSNDDITIAIMRRNRYAFKNHVRTVNPGRINVTPAEAIAL